MLPLTVGLLRLLGPRCVQVPVAWRQTAIAHPQQQKWQVALALPHTVLAAACVHQTSMPGIMWGEHATLSCLALSRCSLPLSCQARIVL